MEKIYSVVKAINGQELYVTGNVYKFHYASPAADIEELNVMVLNEDICTILIECEKGVLVRYCGPKASVKECLYCSIQDTVENHIGNQKAIDLNNLIVEIIEK